MNRKVFGNFLRRCRHWASGAVVLALCWTGWASAQTGPEPGALNLAPTANAPAAEKATGHLAIKDENVVPAGCATCSGGLLGGSGGMYGPPNCAGGCCAGGCGSGCGPCGIGQCVPGRTNCCSVCDDTTVLGRLLCGLYCCICCPDPCYDPCWNPIANAAFFTDPVRPVTMTRIRWDSVVNYTLPDRSEFFMARLGNAGGKGTAPIVGMPPAPARGGPEINAGRITGAKNTAFLASLRYNDLMFYQEVAVAKASFFFEMPYRSLDPQGPYPHAANFGDLNLGVKSLFFDCELLQLAFQFRTYLPTGNFTKGIGTGHVSLEPSLLGSLKLTPNTYLQGQLAEWIPIGGDPSYQGAILHYHLSANQVLWRLLPDVPLIGTFEFNGYSFQAGQFTDPINGPFQQSSGDTYISVGPGLRLVVCNKIDFGVGTAFAVDHHGPGQWYRTEFRWRF